MLRILLYIFAPGEKPSSGHIPPSIGYDGLDWRWAAATLVLLPALLIWSYGRFSAIISLPARIALISMRSLFLALLLLILVRPVLILPIEETIRHPLLVLIDLSKSMGLTDHREDADLVRAAIAEGSLNPSRGLTQGLFGVKTDDLKLLPRPMLLRSLAANARLNLWPRLQAGADLVFFGFGRQLRELPSMAPASGGKITADAASAFFAALPHEDDLTSLGDGLRDLLDQKRGDSVAGILLITDGGNNAGSSPEEAAATAGQDGVPLFIYGVGVQFVKDIAVLDVTSPITTNVREKLDLTVHFRVHGLAGRKANVQIKVHGTVVAEEPIEFHADGEQEVNFSYTPTEIGDMEVQAFIPPLSDEADQNNNSAIVRVRVVDDKINLLFVEGEPRWEYQYLLAMLQRDRRIRLKCVLLNGDPDSGSESNSPFLDQMPEDKNGLFSKDVIILGNVNPTQMENVRMNLIQEWVGKHGGGLIFLAGRQFDPSAYQGTPLDPLLPVVAGPQRSESYPDEVRLRLTPAGLVSPILQLSKNAMENAEIWNHFRGVRWTAPIEKIRPGAQVLLVDPTQSRASANGPVPVMALQNYGLGHSLYIGCDETYHWRSNQGEKYYTQIWGQIIQYLGDQHEAGATALTRLKTDRSHYFTGDRILISGRLFKSNFEPITSPEVRANVVISAVQSSDRNASKPSSIEVRLHAVPGQPGEYRGEMTADSAGSYSLSTPGESSATLKFEVGESTLELSDSAMNEKLLREIAAASGGRFLREENLDDLPNLIASKSTALVSFKRIPLTTGATLLGFIILVACAEWFWRRKRELK